tara:strand:+ start:239 stop:1273 length:1035 start_codon:yes stop_codon:yes gene_type:complete
MQNKKLLPIDKFIELALYDKKKGYYMKKNPFGNLGDFTTSPNISVLFSEMLSIWIVLFCKSLKNLKQINIIELGAGNGEMIYQIIKTINVLNNNKIKIKFFIYEKSIFLQKIQKKKLKNFSVRWIKSFNQLNNNTNLFICNEFIDSFPIKQFSKTKGKWCEKYVDLKKRVFKYKNINIVDLEKKFKLSLSKNQNFIEFSPSLYSTLKNISEKIKKTNGGILIIDYFNMREDMRDSLQSIKRHKKQDFLKNVGNADITYVPNYRQLKNMFSLFGLKVGGLSNQGDFLTKLGIEKRAEILSKNSLFTEKANIFFRMKRLVDVRKMGKLFKVIFICNKKINFKFGLK